MSQVTDDLSRAESLLADTLPGQVAAQSEKWSQWVDSGSAVRSYPDREPKFAHIRGDNRSFDFHFRTPPRVVSCGLYWFTKKDLFQIRFELLEEEGLDAAWMDPIWSKAKRAFPSLTMGFPGAREEHSPQGKSRRFAWDVPLVTPSNLTEESCAMIASCLAKFIDRIGEDIVPLEG